MWSRVGRIACKTTTGQQVYPDDGFTLNFLTANGSAFLQPYLLLGGDGLQTYVGTFASATGGATSTAVSGVGFQPECVIMWGVSTTGSQNSAFPYCIGAASGTGSTAQFAQGMHHIYNTAGPGLKQYFATGKCYVDLSLGTYGQGFTLSSFDSDGFTVTHEAAGAKTIMFLALADSNGTFEVGYDTQKTSTGTKDTSLSNDPDALMIVMSGTATADSVQDDATEVVGLVGQGVSGSAVQFVSGTRKDEPFDGIIERQHEGGAAYFGTYVGAPPYTYAEASATLGTSKFTLDWTTADAVARYFGYVALSSSTAETVDTAKAILFPSFGRTVTESGGTPPDDDYVNVVGNALWGFGAATEDDNWAAGGIATTTVFNESTQYYAREYAGIWGGEVEWELVSFESLISFVPQVIRAQYL